MLTQFISLSFSSFELLTCCLSLKIEALSLVVVTSDLPDIVLNVTCNYEKCEKKYDMIIGRKDDDNDDDSIEDDDDDDQDRQDDEDDDNNDDEDNDDDNDDDQDRQEEEEGGLGEASHCSSLRHLLDKNL